MSEQEWNNSRWDFLKSKSNWHFDEKRLPEAGKDSYTYICNFNGDFTDVIAQCKERAVISSWSTRNKAAIAGELYSATAEEADLERAGANPKMEVFARDVADDQTVFKNIHDHFGMEEAVIKFHNQTTGQMLVEHIDNFAGRPERENSFKETDMETNPEGTRRFVIMLDDWHLGQAFQLGNASWTQWKAGDCITWEWQDIPHATCNMGWDDRPMLQITGKVTDQTLAVLANQCGLSVDV